ncbi:hypothetical protein [Chitinophaga alhagiae]|uniref:hypothetical protein n=1 Tax=Chitinophaga alhagiae TaxID=2203219 RepID=UPI000E5B3230|nr:hypothetical protein [Chitinophaga alhagiae]
MKLQRHISVWLLGMLSLGCQKKDGPNIKSNEEDVVKMIGILLPAVQKASERATWEPAGSGLHRSKITLTEEERTRMHRTVGAPDIRIFIEGDTAKNGRSLPYTKLLEEKSRIVYYYEWDGQNIILYRQFSGSPERKGEIEIISTSWGWSSIYPDFPLDMKAAEQQRLMALLLPAVQKVRDVGHLKLVKDGVLATETTFTDEESRNMDQAIGKPDVRIFLAGDTAKDGRSMPYTTLLPGSATRVVYYYERVGQQLIIRYQSTGSPTAGAAAVESISMNYVKIKF